MSSPQRDAIRGELKRIREFLKLANLVIEVRDARAPWTTSLDGIVDLGSKLRLVVLSRSDLADRDLTAEWKQRLIDQGQFCIAMNLKRHGRTVQTLLKTLEGMIGRVSTSLGVVRGIVVGLPNVGKSSLINRLKGLHVARAANEPGVTRGRQWVQLNQGLFLLDTPGIIQITPRIIRARGDDAWKLAALNLLPPSEFDPEEISGPLLSLFSEGLWPDQGQLDQTQSIEQYARDNRFSTEDGFLDLEKAAKHALTAFRKGKLGTLTLESPPEPDLHSSLDPSPKAASRASKRMAPGTARGFKSPPDFPESGGRGSS